MKWKDHHHGLSTLIWIPVLLCVSGPERWVKIRLGFLAHKDTYISCSHPHTTATLFFSKHHFVKDIPTLKNLLLDFRDHPQYGLQFNDSTFFSSVQSLSRVWLSVIPWTTAHQASLSITNSWSLLKLMSIVSVMPSNHLILCHPLLLLPSIFPSIRVFSNESVLHIRWPKYWSFSFSISPSNEYSGLISFRIDWLDLLAVQGTLKSLLQHHSSKASILWRSAFCIVQLSHP